MSKFILAAALAAIAFPASAATVACNNNSTDQAAIAAALPASGQTLAVTGTCAISSTLAIAAGTLDVRGATLARTAYLGRAPMVTIAPGATALGLK